MVHGAECSTPRAVHSLTGRRVDRLRDPQLVLDELLLRRVVRHGQKFVDQNRPAGYGNERATFGAMVIDKQRLRPDQVTGRSTPSSIYGETMTKLVTGCSSHTVARQSLGFAGAVFFAAPRCSTSKSAQPRNFTRFPLSD